MNADRVDGYWCERHLDWHCGMRENAVCAAEAWALAGRLEQVLTEAREGFSEAYDYGCQWPIGTDDEPQEQRGMSRDTFIRNMEFYGEKIDAALAGDGETKATQ